MCVLNVILANLYLYNTALSVLFCVNKNIIINGLHNVDDFILNYTVCEPVNSP